MQFCARNQPAKRFVAPAAAYQYYLTQGQAPLLDRAAWEQVVLAIGAALAQRLLAGETLYLPCRLGHLLIGKKKMSFARPTLDYGETRKQGRKVYCFNDHSDGYQSFLYWRKITCTAKNQGCYGFRPVRGLSRALGQLMKQPLGHGRYPIISKK